jgi:hypothetical protein
MRAQDSENNGVLFPIFPNCENVAEKETCFYSNLNNIIYNNFKVPNDLKLNSYKGTIVVLFEVDEKGIFKIQFIDADEKALTDEARRVFGLLPTINPPTYNGLPTYQKCILKIAIPLKTAAEITAEKYSDVIHFSKKDNKELTELESITLHKFNNPLSQSHLNIPFSHSYYAHFDEAMNKIGSNAHTASKPFSYAEVLKYYDLKAEKVGLQKKSNDWWSRKFWNENLLEIQGDDYWFTVNPIFDLQVGKSNSSNKDDTTYLNSRGLQVQGELGKVISFTTTLYENQAHFANYFNQYAESIKPYGGNPATIPGMGIAKSFNKNDYDFPVSEANLTYIPSHFMNMQLGFGRNFIGDGYRSLLEGDGASPNPYFKLNTSFWRFKYTNTYMWLKDTRSDVMEDKTYATKYMANHYLSYNVSNRLNLGFFESVVWANDNKRGFDMNFANPIIFYRTVEFGSSSKSSNALLALTAKYKYSNSTNIYGQFLIDEFSLGDVKSGEDSWKNKFGYQLGFKYFNAFKIKNLLLQLEYNQVRPYVYSHLEAITNYGHNNQSIGHQWGGNFQEFLAIGRYHKDRFFADGKITFGQRGLDFDNTANYGSNIYLSYDSNRPLDTGVKTGQGNKTNIFIADLQAGYLINPSTNLKLYGSVIYRNFNPTANTATVFKDETFWFSLGLRCDLFNWYFDY